MSDPLTVDVTPGYTFVPGELVTTDKLNKLGNPVVKAAGSITASTIEAGSVGTDQLGHWALSADAAGRDKMEPKYLQNDKLDDATVKPEKVSLADFVGFFTPIGTIMWSPMELETDVTTPDNGVEWVEAAGQTLPSDPATGYKRLSDVYGVLFNTTGEGEGTFRVPDLKGRFLRGRDTAATPPVEVGDQGGEATHKLTAAEIQHTTVQTTVPVNHGAADVPDVLLSVGVVNVVELVDGQPNAIVAHNTLPPYQVGVYYIAAAYRAGGVRI